MSNKAESSIGAFISTGIHIKQFYQVVLTVFGDSEIVHLYLKMQIECDPKVRLIRQLMITCNQCKILSNFVFKVS